MYFAAGLHVLMLTASSFQFFVNMLPPTKRYEPHTYDVKNTVSVKVVIQTNKLILRFPHTSLPSKVDYNSPETPPDITYNEAKDIIIDFQDLRVKLLPDDLSRSK